MPYSRIKTGNLTRRFECYENEVSMAAYLLFTDQAAFRHLNTKFEEVTEILKSATELDDLFPLLLEEIVDKYHKPLDAENEDREYDYKKTRCRNLNRKGLRQDRFLASLLRYLVHCTSDAFSRATTEEKARFQNAANDEFAKCTGLRIPSVHQVTQVDQPAWGPLEAFGEQPFEEYNRAYLVLRRLIHVVRTDGLWESEFQSACSFQRFLIPFPAVPWWMVVPKSPGALKQPLPVEMAPHNYKLCLDPDETTHTRRLQRHVKSFLEPKGLRLPQSNETVPCHADPRIFDYEEDFLDAVRMQLNLVKLRVQFLSFDLLFENGDTLRVCGPSRPDKWSEI
ncbi:hypothetical protein IWZ03DRAFT_426307 [Phyllosticta citriasiana]|uniref:Uncharacterized protein n=1 Tax=Phyllosticta citriasiana TaxID=595635 RepID=A0ABR1KB34_9PEZI